MTLNWISNDYIIYSENIVSYVSSKVKVAGFDLDHTLWDFEANSKEALTEIYYNFNLAEMGIVSFNEFLRVYYKINDRKLTSHMTL